MEDTAVLLSRDGFIFYSCTGDDVLMSLAANVYYHNIPLLFRSYMSASA